MREAAARLEFERAAHLRDQINALKNPPAAPAKTIEPVTYPTARKRARKTK